MSESPRHIAIIMDGNGRWAQQRNLSRSAGHKAGGEAAKAIIKSCAESGIEVLTLFAFGVENWNRPTKEVNYLMNLFFRNLEKSHELHDQNIKLSIIGDYSRFSEKLRQRIIKSQELTANNTGLHLNAAINYSGRWDIINAAKQLAQQVNSDNLAADEITEEVFAQFLCLHDVPEPDLFIRTSGEQRISNFLLWQLAYTELYFTDVLWPDFNKEELEKALQAYATRERRFGRVSA